MASRETGVNGRTDDPTAIVAIDIKTTGGYCSINLCYTRKIKLETFDFLTSFRGLFQKKDGTQFLWILTR